MQFCFFEMSKVWRRLQRVGKKATKFRFQTHSHILKIDCTSKWQPDRVCITWSRRERKITSKLAQWEPGQKNVFDGTVYWEKSSDFLEFDVSLYRGINDDKFEQKEWILSIEAEEAKGKRRLLATGALNLDEYASLDPYLQTDIADLKLKVISTKIKSATISFSLTCQFVKVGNATDEDMISIASFMSSTSNLNTLSNPYLNSNVLFQPHSAKLERKSFESTDTNESKFDYTVNLDEDPDDIRQYINMNSDQLISNFNSIQNNFGPTQTVISEEPENEQNVKSNEFEENFLKLLETNNPTSKPIKENVPAKKVKPQAPVKKEETKKQPQPPIEPKVEKNPFLDDADENDSANTTNPFIETSANSTQLEEKNPFLNDTSDDLQLVPETKIDRKSLDLNISSTGRELLDWCKDVVKKKTNKSVPMFRSLQVEDFSKSWLNGLALCAIIHSYRPSLIDTKSLNENEPKKNLKQAFTASDSEKIVRIVDYNDFMRGQLDQLAIMTYLSQLRSHFDSEKSKLVSPKSPSRPAVVKQQTSVQTTPTKVTSHNFKNPFDSDDDSSKKENKKPTGLIQIKSNGDIVPDSLNEQINDVESSQSSTVKRRIRKSSVSDATKKVNDLKLNHTNSNNNNNSNTNKSDELIQKAKDLIEKTKQSDTAKREELNQKVKQLLETNKTRKKSVATPTTSPRKESICSMENSPSLNESSIIGTEYVNQEIINLRNEQKELDEQGDSLEKQLRILMKSSKEKEKKSEKERELEDHLLKEWFLLVNRKNALLHKQQELEILQNEKDLEKRYEILSNKLRDLMAKEDFFKTDEEKKLEQILLNELINNVVKRNELVIQLDEENKLLNEGEMINEYIQNKASFQSNQDKSCIIQ